MSESISRRRVLRGGLLAGLGLAAEWPAAGGATGHNPVIAVHRSRASARLRAAVETGEQALQDFATPGAAERLPAILADLRRMLESAKVTAANLKHAKNLMSFEDPLIDFQIRKTEHTFGLIRHGLDQTNLPWEQYLAEVVPKLAEAVATLRQVLELML